MKNIEINLVFDIDFIGDTYDAWFYDFPIISLNKSIEIERSIPYYQKLPKIKIDDINKFKSKEDFISYYNKQSIKKCNTLIETIKTKLDNPIDEQLKLVIQEKKIKLNNAKFRLFKWLDNKGIIIDDSEWSSIIQNPDSSKFIKKDKYDSVNRELQNAQNIIKKKRKKDKALILITGRPNKDTMAELIDKHRKLNGIVNYSSIGRALKRDPDTIKRWIQQFGLSEYALKPI